MNGRASNGRTSRRNDAGPGPPCGTEALADAFGRIDIYVFDQLLRGRITPDMRILDAGSGNGRNSRYLIGCGADVFAVDADPEKVERVRELAARAAPGLPSDNFRTADLSDLPFPDARFDAVICSAVLHFAPNAAAFERMVAELWRVLAPHGVLFVRLASSIGIEDRVELLEERRCRLPDGSERFLVDEAYLALLEAELGASRIDPLKTTVVHDLRSMSTWVLGRGGI